MVIHFELKIMIRMASPCLYLQAKLNSLQPELQLKLKIRAQELIAGLISAGLGALLPIIEVPASEIACNHKLQALPAMVCR